MIEIENVLYRHPSVRQAAIVAMPGRRLGERPCAFAVLQPEKSFSFTEMQAFLRESGVARSYWPEHLELVGTMPMTATGKIQKFVLREMAGTLRSAADHAPRIGSGGNPSAHACRSPKSTLFRGCV
ncbi:AMP-binding enzyme [Bradyrhizobium monzae]